MNDNNGLTQVVTWEVVPSEQLQPQQQPPTLNEEKNDALVVSSPAEVVEVVDGLAPSPEVVTELTSEIEAIVSTKAQEFHAAKIEMYWNIGETLLRYSQEQGISITKLIEHVARTSQMGIKERALWDATIVFKAFPQKELVYSTEHGNNITITKIRTMLGMRKEDRETFSPRTIIRRLRQKYTLEELKQIYKHLRAEIDTQKLLNKKPELSDLATNG